MIKLNLAVSSSVEKVLQLESFENENNVLKPD